MNPENVRKSTHDYLVAEGYKLVEDAWIANGRRTYVHDEDASRVLIRRLMTVLTRDGWEMETAKLRSLRHVATGEVIELEPGGADTSGHFLHHMKSSPPEG
jgi:hypothetical protein